MSKDMKYTTTIHLKFHDPRPFYLWDFFGDGMFLIDYIREVSWWKKFWTKIFFGSRWDRYKHSNEIDFGDDDRSIDK